MRAPETSWRIIAGLATAALGLSIVPLAFHPDDLFILANDGGSLADIWSESFLDRFYRPLTSTLVHLSRSAFGHTPVPLRALQALLVATTAALLWRLTGDLDRRARVAGLLALLASPFTFVSIAPFAVGVSDSIVAIALLAAMTRARGAGPGSGGIGAADIVLVAVALAAKETGLLVAAFVVITALRQRRGAVAVATVAAALAYLALRHAIVPSQPIMFGTGFFFESLTPAELGERFAGGFAPLYAYNVAANLISVVAYVPLKGQISFAGTIVPYALLTLATSVTIAATLISRRQLRATAPLWLLIPCNAVLGFAYVRPRVMFVAAIVAAFLFARAIDANRERTWLVNCALGAWSLAFAVAIARLWMMP